jgi:hypothetical protein
MGKKKVSKSLKVTNIDNLEESSGLEYLLQLMMAANAMRSAIRWVYLLDAAGDKEEPTDRFQAMIVGAGFCAEGIRLVKKGANDAFVDVAMLRKDKILLDSWTMCVAKPVPAIVRKIFRIRDNYFAHWDDDKKNRRISKAFIQGQKEGDEAVPFISSSADGKILQTCFPWAEMAIAKDLIREDKDDERAIRDLISEIGKTQAKILNLVLEFIKELSQASGLEWEPCESE